MRHTYSSIDPTTIQHAAADVLERHLKPKPYKNKVPSAELVRLLLFIAANTTSLAAAVRSFPCCYETYRRAIDANLPATPELTACLNDMLYDVLELTDKEWQQSWVIAIDTHNDPYYGRTDTPHICGGQKKQGTKYFFTYASAVIVHPRRRYTVGLIPVRPGQKPHEIVTALVTLIEQQGLKIRGIVLDSGFDSGDVLLFLQQRRYSYAVPLRRKGKGTNRRNECFTWPDETVATIDWKTERTNARVTTKVVTYRATNSTEVKVFAFGGWSSQTTRSFVKQARVAREQYRRRFGIETSYRQKNQGRGQTTSPREDYRLLLEGLAQLLRQLWVALTARIATAHQIDVHEWIGDLTFEMLCEALVEVLKTTYKFNLFIDLRPKTDASPNTT
jgi:hypothetical protein